VNTRLRGLQTLDLVAYAVVVTSAVFCLGLAAGLAVGNGLIGAKWLLFAVGFLLVAYGALRLRPTPKWKDESRLDFGDDPRGLQRLVADALPADYRLPTDDRFPVGLKLFVAGLTVLLTSFLMESVFGVGIGL
jgi:hypothetical protein